MFDDLPEKVVLDSSYQTNLANEFLLNQDGFLEIQQLYTCGKASAKLTSTSAIALHPVSNNERSLLELKQSELKKLARENEIDLVAIDARANAPIRHAIWTNLGTDDLELKNISLDKEGAKQVIDSLSTFFPSFALFKSDRASTDQDDEAQDPLKAAIREATKAVQGEIDAITRRVEGEVKKIANLTLTKIKEMDESLAKTLDPEVTVKDLSSLFKTNIVGDEGIPLNKRGTGVKRLILLNFFRAKAEQIAKHSNQYSLIYAVEEPETGQHPKHQKMLIEALKEISENSQTQVFLTTHSPMLARSINTARLRFLQNDENGLRRIDSGGDDEINKDIAKTLGVLPDHNVKAFIAIEGENDVRFLRSISSSLCSENFPNIPDLVALEEDGKIVFIPLGGSNLSHSSSRFSGLNVPEYHIYDRDNTPPHPPKYQETIDAVNTRENAFALCTRKREMENYLCPREIEQYYESTGITFNLPDEFADFDDVPNIVARAIHDASNDEREWDLLTKEKKKKKESKAKKLLNQEVPVRMTSQTLLTTDPNNEILSWLETIDRLVNDHGFLQD